MTKSQTKPIKPVPEENQSHKGPGSAPDVPLDTTKGHRDDEKQNIREQGDHGNMVQNTTQPAVGLTGPPGVTRITSHQGLSR